MKRLNMILLPSKYLVNVRLNDQSYIFYHSLFGGAVMVKRGVVDLIQRFNGGIDFEQAFTREEISAYRSSILDLKKRHFLVKKGIDERSLLKKNNKKFEESLATGRFIRNLRFEMASFCNFRCQHCFAPKIYDWRKGAKMSLHTAKFAVEGFIDILREAGNKRGKIIFWGGEPLLNWRVVQKIVGYVEAITENSQISIDLGVITNASLFDTKILKFMKQHRLKATVSLDGLEKENDRFRKFIKGKGTFKAIIKGIDGLFKFGIPFWVELCLNDYNFNSVEKVIDFLQNRYKRFTFIVAPIFYQQSLSNFDSHSNQEKAKRLVEIYDYAIKRGTNINVADGVSLLKSAIKEGFSPRHACCGLFNSLYVKPSGLVCSCHKITKSIGRVERLKEIPQGGEYKYVAMREVGRIRGCQGCEIEGFCAGGCAGIAEFYSGDIYDTSNPLFQNFYCDFHRHLFREMLRYVAQQEDFRLRF